MGRLVFTVTGAVSLGLLGACGGTRTVTGATNGSGTLVTESRPVEGFAGVSVSGGGHLIVQQTGAESLEITAEDNILPLIRSEVVNGTLILGFAPGVRVGTPHAVEYRLSVRHLTGLEASGASRVEIEALDTPLLASVVSGASSLHASGRATTQAIVLSGASRCETPDLLSRVVTATFSGASYGLVQATSTLTAGLSGASTLEYYGDPVLAVNTSGGSVVRHIRP